MSTSFSPSIHDPRWTKVQTTDPVVQCPTWIRGGYENYTPWLVSAGHTIFTDFGFGTGEMKSLWTLTDDIARTPVAFSFQPPTRGNSVWAYDSRESEKRTSNGLPPEWMFVLGSPNSPLGSEWHSDFTHWIYAPEGCKPYRAPVDALGLVREVFEAPSLNAAPTQEDDTSENDFPVSFPQNGVPLRRDRRSLTS